MEVVNTLDIDGTQWELQDVEARNRIAGVEQLLKVEAVGDIPIILNSGNSANQASVKSIQRFGKIHLGLIYIDRLVAKNIGTLYRVDIGTVNINVLQDTYSLGYDNQSGKTVRIRIGKNKNIYFEESLGVSSGNNGIFSPITWIEL